MLVPTHGTGPGSDLIARLRFAGCIAEANGGILLPVVIAVPQENQDLSGARAKLKGIDDALHSLGLEGDSRLRVDRSLSEGISRAAVENEASLVLLRWPGPRPITRFFVESVADEVSRLVECPVAVAALSDSPAERVVLAVSEDDLGASRVDDLRAAVNIATAAAAHQRLIVGPVAPELLVEAGMTLPERAEHVGGETDLVQWAEQTSGQSDLVVAVSRGRAAGRTAAEIHELGRSVVAVTASKAPRWITGAPSPVISSSDA